MQKTAKEIAFFIKGEVIGDGSVKISNLASIDSAKENDIAFALSKEHFPKIADTGASCVVVPKDYDGPSNKTLIKIDKPRETFIYLLTTFYKPHRKKPGIDPTAVVSKKAKLGRGVYVGACAVIEEEVAIGNDSVIDAGVFVGRKSTIGNKTTINPNVTIYHHCYIGNNCIIHSGTVIGSDGFGFIQKDGIQHKIPQVGKVIIRDNVEIGSNCSIDRATIGQTVIGEGTKLDNLIQVAHNIDIGKNVVIAGQSGIAGSTVIEDNAIIAAQVGIKDHVRIGKGAIMGAKCGVKGNVEPGKIVAGIPAREGRDFAREIAALSKLTKNINKILQLLKKT